MDRRKTLKTILGGAVGTAFIGGSVACERTGDPVPASATEAENEGYGLRTAYEAEREAQLRSERFFSDYELETLVVLGNIIIPNVEESGFSEFCEFMAKDQPGVHATRLRGGLAWLNAESSRNYEGKSFNELTDDQRIAIVDSIAYPDPEANVQPPGVQFFNHARFMAMTCYYTSRQGIKDLGYVGNQPNVWDGPPQEVLDKYDLAYDPQWLPLYVDQEKRNEQVQWDENGNVIRG
ncbi:gluconate 2-dehydrogenase subunit 3-like protein [Neolewinella xylanilytica]|uniref:Gluconate 2-dehydrogenase subunit 3-like protein n=1 Tax=Neolewinella xylanilytica TaxID=1514080 RepID=A0A2S6IBG5_9BACT|nr:gluconate 2-dehydrogenase subunit 3 family protein [Neolewinella xylanilytica]PPK88854.1 gluconate 2-dehydrogenase subunit 3-like protein [Neolewinella xylanilytica]